MTITTLKKKAWKLFSEYIRRSNSDKNDRCQCVTCGKMDHWKNMQAGHFIDGRNNTVLFDERLVHPQCYHCNVGLRGNKIKYTKYMSERFGYTLQAMNDLDDLKFATKKMYISDYEKLITDLKLKLKELE